MTTKSNKHSGVGFGRATKSTKSTNVVPSPLRGGLWEARTWAVDSLNTLRSSSPSQIYHDKKINIWENRQEMDSHP